MTRIIHKPVYLTCSPGYTSTNRDTCRSTGRKAVLKQIRMMMLLKANQKRKTLKAKANVTKQQFTVPKVFHSSRAINPIYGLFNTL